MRQTLHSFNFTNPSTLKSFRVAALILSSIFLFGIGAVNAADPVLKDCPSIKINDVQVSAESNFGANDGAISIFFSDKDSHVGYSIKYEIEGEEIIKSGYFESPIILKGLDPGTYNKVRLSRIGDNCGVNVAPIALNIVPAGSNNKSEEITDGSYNPDDSDYESQSLFLDNSVGSKNPPVLLDIFNDCGSDRKIDVYTYGLLDGSTSLPVPNPNNFERILVEIWFDVPECPGLDNLNSIIIEGQTVNGINITNTSGAPQAERIFRTFLTVSYTHLTLPTILLV